MGDTSEIYKVKDNILRGLTGILIVICLGIGKAVISQGNEITSNRERISAVEKAYAEMHAVFKDRFGRLEVADRDIWQELHNQARKHP